MEILSSLLLENDKSEKDSWKNLKALLSSNIFPSLNICSQTYFKYPEDFLRAKLFLFIPISFRIFLKYFPVNSAVSLICFDIGFAHSMFTSYGVSLNLIVSISRLSSLAFA